MTYLLLCAVWIINDHTFISISHVLWIMGNPLSKCIRAANLDQHEDGNARQTRFNRIMAPPDYGIIAKRFSKLYNNEWKYAFEYLQANKNMKNKKIIKKLVKILKHIYFVCRNKANTDKQGLFEADLKVTGDPEMAAEFRKTVENLNHVRKWNYKTNMPDFEMNNDILPGKLLSETDRNDDRMMAYVRSCTEICWLMCIQDPPVYMETRFKKRGRFDQNIYTEYTRTGMFNGYLVWPALYLSKGGQLLRQGVAQPKRLGRTDSSSATNTSDCDTAELPSKGNPVVNQYINDRPDYETTLPGTDGENAVTDTASSLRHEELKSPRSPNNKSNQLVPRAEESSVDNIASESPKPTGRNKTCKCHQYQMAIRETDEEISLLKTSSSAANASDRDTVKLPNNYNGNSVVNPFIKDGSDDTDRPCTAASVRLEESTSPRSPSHKSNQLVTIAEESSVAYRSPKGRRHNRGQMQCKCYLYQMAIKEKDKEISELKTRLSSIMSHKLTDNNPDIADLSDQNRPTLLADRFSELYSNEWTDAFEYLQEKNNEKDKKKIKKLVKILTHIYNTCRRKVETDTQGVLEAVTKMVGEPEMTTEFKIAFKNLKDVRKQNYKTCMPDFEKNTYELPGKIMSNVDRNESRMMAYVRLCTELCWLMCIQDPPVYMETQFEKGEQFDKGIYSEYTKTGKANGYLVWPALYLYKGGQLLRKGVAQPKIARTGGRVDVDENRSPPV